MKILKVLIKAAVSWVVLAAISLLLSLSGINLAVFSFFYGHAPQHEILATYMPEGLGYFLAGSCMAIIIKKNIVKISILVLLIEITSYLGMLLLNPLATETIPSPPTLFLLKCVVASFLVLGAIAGSYGARYVLSRSSRDSN